MRIERILSAPTHCLKQGHVGQAAQVCVQLSSVYPCDTGSTTSLTSSFSFWLPSFWKKIMPWYKISGLDQCECEKMYYFATKNVFSFQ